ncbi:uncharacterized protein LOC135485150 [Lineus longissimus]|uniref:uncharacterized protein LOC135485150 n=1 Tax=Lineus longissimus TaxID=88925 RepID=UPI00315C7B5D
MSRESMKREVYVTSALDELKRASDIDNSTTIGLIEKKLPFSDRLKWATHQQTKGIQPSISTLLEWMKGEIWIRQVAGAEIRSVHSSQSKHAVNLVGTDDKDVTSPQSQARSQHGTEVPFVDNSTYQKPAEIGQVPSRRTSWNCWVCNKDVQHKPEDCQTFKDMNLETRLTVVRKARACYFCLNIHRALCRSRKRCEIVTGSESCPYSHHPLLHGASFDRAASNTSVSMCSSNLLPVLKVNGINPRTNGSKSGIRLFDSGSQLSLIRSDYARTLGLSGENIVINISKVGGQEELLETQVHKLQVQSLDGKSQYIIRVIAIDKISADIASVDPKCLNMCENNSALLNRGAGPVDILIGFDHAKFFSGSTDVQGRFAIHHSILGTVIFGAMAVNHGMTHGLYQVSLLKPVDMSTFWSTEEMGVALNPCCAGVKKSQDKPLGLIEKREATMIRDSATKVGNRWMIPLPWRRDPAEFPDNYNQAKAKLVSTEKRLMRNPEHWKMYDGQIKALVEKGSARKLTQEEIQTHTGPVHYISHHAVYSPEKKTTPCRIVFNSAASYQGHVLNEYLRKGPDLLNNLLGVLTRFPENHVAIVGDVSKMYHQILVDPVRDAHTHRFLWRDFEKRAPDVYVKQVLTFGDVSSPALANTAIDLTTEEYEETFPEAVATIKRCRYMDYIGDSLPTIPAATKRTEEIDEIFDSGHFKIKEWISNEQLGRNGNPATDNSDQMGDEKFLGVLWDRDQDNISIPMKIPKCLSRRPWNAHAGTCLTN